MTALHLLALLSAALLIQAALGAAVVLWRRRARLAQAPEREVSGEVAADAKEAGAWPGWRDFRVARRQFEDAAETQCSFLLEPVDGALLPAFKPGQYLTFSLQVGQVEEAANTPVRSLIRCYSLSDAPDPSHYRITVKRAPAPAGRPELPPGVASGHWHDHVREGDVLQVKAPAGRFFIDTDPALPAVFIAGGIGITPLLSMLRWCAAQQPERSLHLYYGVRNGADHAFKEVLNSVALAHPSFHLHVVYGSPGSDDLLGRDYQHLGFIDLALLRSGLPHGRHSFYVCGPPPMMESLVPALRAWGVQEEDLHFEAFGPASVRPVALVTNERSKSSAGALEVRLSRSGRTLIWDGQDANLLDFAERQGVAVASGCRSGSCGACQTPLVSGSVGYAESPDFDIAPGHCLLCVGKPKSALVLDV